MATEKRLISVDEWDSFFAEHIYNRCFRNEYEQGYTDALDRVDDWMDYHPTVDAVEVVRCKECRWARPQDHREPVDTPTQALICECFMHHHIPAPWGARLAVKPDGFCSCGERRTDG